MTIKEIDNLFIDLANKNDKIRYPAFKKLLKITDKKVNWIYDKWFLLLEKINSENSFQRSIGLTLLANLAKSDTENRIEKILDEYLEHFQDEKFITARLCIQNVWRIAAANIRAKKKIIDRLESSYHDNFHFKTHPNLIKQDIIGSLIYIGILTKDKNVISLVESFIENEVDMKYQKVLRSIAAKSKADAEKIN